MLISLDSWKTFFEIGGVVLLFLTFLFGAGAWYTTRKINARQAEQLRGFQQTLTRADEELAQTKLDLSTQQQRTAEAETQAAQAKDTAAKSEFALLELQNRLAHRSLTAEQEVRLISLLKPYAGTRIVVRKLGDDEASAFAEDVLSVLAKAGWAVQLNSIGSMSPPPYGVRCGLNPKLAASAALRALCKELPGVSLFEEPNLDAAGSLLIGLRNTP